MSSSEKEEKYPVINPQFKRPTNFPFPHIWHRFQVTSINEDVIYQMRVQDLTPERHEEILTLFQEQFYPDEPTFECLNLKPEALSDCIKSRLKFKLEAMKQNVSLVVLLDHNKTNKSKIVGAEVLYVVSENDPPIANYDVPEVIRERDRLIDLLLQDIDVFRELGTNAYLKSHGVVVSREFRGLNVLSHIYAAQAKLATSFGIRGAVSTFTNVKSQRLARKANFRILKEINYDSFTNENDEAILVVKGTKSVQFCCVQYF